MIYGRLKYRGYIGAFEFYETTNKFIGRVFYIKPELTFEGTTLENTKKAFCEIVEKQISWSKRKGHSELENDNLGNVFVVLKTV